MDINSIKPGPNERNKQFYPDYELTLLLGRSLLDSIPGEELEAYQKRSKHVDYICNNSIYGHPTRHRNPGYAGQYAKLQAKYR